jgi:hypothetical protein
VLAGRAAAGGGGGGCGGGWVLGSSSGGEDDTGSGSSDSGSDSDSEGEDDSDSDSDSDSSDCSDSEGGSGDRHTAGSEGLRVWDGSGGCSDDVIDDELLWRAGAAACVASFDTEVVRRGGAGLSSGCSPAAELAQTAGQLPWLPALVSTLAGWGHEAQATALMTHAMVCVLLAASRHH